MLPKPNPLGFSSPKRDPYFRETIMSPIQQPNSPYTQQYQLLIDFSPESRTGLLRKRNFRERKLLGCGLGGRKRKSHVMEVCLLEDEKCRYALKSQSVQGVRHRALQTKTLEPLLSIKGNHILKHWQFWQEEGQTHLLTELCENKDLYAYVDSFERTLTDWDIRRIAYEVASGLEVMHANSYVHFDIKPPNIFVKESGSLKIGDFGIMTKCGEDPAVSDGDAKYIPPELVGDFDSTNVTPAIDMFSLGIMLYEISTCYKCLPPTGNHPGYYALRSNTFLFPFDAPVLLKSATQDLIRNLMSQEPNLRLSASDVVALPMLGEFRENMREDSYSPRYNLRPRTQPKSRRKLF